MQSQSRNKTAPSRLEKSRDNPDETTKDTTKRAIFRALKAERAKLFFEPNAFFSLQAELDEPF